MSRELIIDGRRIADDEPAYLIAEIGHNHAGELWKAVQMVDEAIAAGADAVKFQTRTPEEVYANPKSPAFWQPGWYGAKSDNPQWMAETYGEHRKKLEFSPEDWAELFAVCRARGITAFSTPFDHRSAELLAGLDVPAFKIASGDATNKPLLEKVAAYGKPMIISTGGCTQPEVDRIIKWVEPSGTPFALLQCSCIYPCPDDCLNLGVIKTWNRTYPDTVIGLSTHSTNWQHSVCAHALGARIIEHHFTADKTWKGTDNHFSLNPEEFAQLRLAVDTDDHVHAHECDKRIGFRNKIRDDREIPFTVERRKSLYWRVRKYPKQNDLYDGPITADDVIALCPEQKPPVLAPYRLDKLIGLEVRDITNVHDAVMNSDVYHTEQVTRFDLKADVGHWPDSEYKLNPANSNKIQRLGDSAIYVAEAKQRRAERIARKEAEFKGE